MGNRVRDRWRPGVLAVVLGIVLTAFAAGTGAGTAAAQPAPPLFQMPFPCGTTWELDTYGEEHSPALDIVVEHNTGSDALPVLASAAGTVAATYWDDGSGNTVQISHGNGWFTAYYHLMDDPAAFVKKGDPVLPSTRIGRIGSTGGTDWAHLHYEQRYAATGDFTYEKDRVPVRFDGVEYSGLNRHWPSVTSRNCTGGPAPAWQDCPTGQVCFYSGPDGTGTVCRSAVDDPASTCGLRRSYFNNGTEQPGYDHVQVSFREGGGQCLHFGWAEGRGNFPDGGRTVDAFRWRGEC
ncbi:peptidoglycan DD-metalloendopeptidase family protein [Kitasatospora sp. NPDC092039]|uniref:peptidoglycan DD-metalloendopeptidase family protein n=1 Tax=Kitasatospora sp. NPDC092039 TaxID=3364086 RepID=UPI0037F762A2